MGDCDMPGLLGRRIARMPPETQALMTTLACLGGDGALPVLQAAASLDRPTLETRLAPALEDGLLVAHDGHARAIRFRHDRVQQAVHERTIPADADDTRDERFARDPYFKGQAQCSMVMLPILSKGALRAMVMLENRLSQGALSTERMDAVSMIAGQLAVSLDNALLVDALEDKVAERTAALQEANRQLALLSSTDALTGVANRRQFNQTLDAEWLRARRTGQPIGLVMVDVDLFKRYNDHHGHQGGDRCLQRVASALATDLRAGADLVARYGGEEFVLLLPNIDLAGARAVAERARAAVAGLHEPHPVSAAGIVTVSLGVAALAPQDALRAAMLIQLADQALYEAKRTCRNRVVVAPVPVPP